jgi:prepilin-type processing-associated H-X9-DG protein
LQNDVKTALSELDGRVKMATRQANAAAAAIGGSERVSPDDTAAGGEGAGGRGNVLMLDAAVAAAAADAAEAAEAGAVHVKFS